MGADGIENRPLGVRRTSARPFFVVFSRQRSFGAVSEGILGFFSDLEPKTNHE